MRIRSFISTLGLFLAVFAALFLLVSVPSHTECGTIGIDYMPCRYWDRVWWWVQIGAFIPLSGVALALALMLQSFGKRDGR